MFQLAFIGGPEVWIVLGILVVLFGARKLPELARSMGSSVTQFKRGLKDEQPKLGDSKSSDSEDADGPAKD
ncbi:MAG: sec-independent protein translocase protein TatA [Planctomycetota bacterium]|jgi:sec-independent protein translocase protein TatA